MRSVMQVSLFALVVLIGFVISPTTTLLLLIASYFSLMYLARNA